MKNASMQLWVEDEVHFQRHSTITRMWALKGKQPRAISASTFNADTFGDFIHYLLQHTEGKLFLDTPFYSSFINNDIFGPD